MALAKRNLEIALEEEIWHALAEEAQSLKDSSVEKLVADVMMRHARKRMRRQERLVKAGEKAPLDEYLPEGVDPYQNGQSINFQKIHQRVKGLNAPFLLGLSDDDQLS